jgi:hypothetical protein
MMRTIKKYFYILMSFVFLGFGGYIFVTYYSYIFAKHVVGQVYEIRRVNQPNLVVGSATAGFNPDIMHSYAVAIRTLSGEIFTSSGSDRKWEVVQKGICVKASFYPYPPWDFEKGGTYSRARLNEMMECPPEYKNLSTLPPDTDSQNKAADPQSAQPLPSANPTQSGAPSSGSGSQTQPQ